MAERMCWMELVLTARRIHVNDVVFPITLDKDVLLDK